jgi:hypothetical protein
MRVSWYVFLPEVVISTFALSVKLRLKADNAMRYPLTGAELKRPRLASGEISLKIVLI